MKTIAALLATLALSGCATTGIPVTAAPRALPLEAMSSCPDSGPVPDGSQKGWETAWADQTNRLGECIRAFDRLVEWIKDGQK